MSHSVRTVPAIAAVVLIGVFAAPAAPRQRQAVWQADVRIQLLEVTALRAVGATAAGGTGSARQLSARVVVTSDNDDEARGVRLDVLLPVGAGAVRIPPGCQTNAASVATLAGRVTCDLGVIPVRGRREVVISTTGTAGGTTAKFAALVSSDTPDPLPGNNYAERGVP